MRQSLTSDSSTPPPRQFPWITDTIGTGSFSRRVRMPLAFEIYVSISSRVVMALTSSISAPTTKLSSLPLTMTSPRTSEPFSISSTSVLISSRSALETLFTLPGQFTVITSILSGVVSTWMNFSFFISPSSGPFQDDGVADGAAGAARHDAVLLAAFFQTVGAGGEEPPSRGAEGVPQ